MNRSVKPRATIRARAIVFSVGAALPFWATLAQAQSDNQSSPVAEPALEQASSPLQLQTVMVTAQRREAMIKDVPVSVSVVTPETINTLTSGGQDIRVLAAKIPSLNIESSNGRTFPRFYLRGYGNTDFSIFASQPVSLILDDVVQENAILKGFPMFDLAGVEVMRGPQGSLFGRNTPAGVVKFDSAKPVLGKQSGYVSVSDGTHNTANLEGAINLPLSDQWALRFSALAQHRDDWVRNDGGGPPPRMAGYNEHAERLQVLYRPDRAFRALFNLHSRATNGSSQLFRANAIKLGSNDLVDGFDPARITTNGENTQTLRSAGGSVNLSWNIERYKLYSITGYETIAKYLTVGDIDGGTPSGPGFIPFQVQSGAGVGDHRQFTQEFRIESKNDDALNWQAGSYYFDEDVSAENIDFDSVTNQRTGYLQNHQKNKAYGVFGALNYDLTENLKLSGGMRYTRDNKDFSTQRAENISFTGPGSISKSKSKFNWDTNAVYTLSPNVNVYARIATGFRAPSIAAPSASVPITVADAETLTSYEAGIKSDLFDKRARANFSVYRYRVKNQQLTAVGGASNAIQLVNAAKTAGHGVEMDLDAQLAPGLRLTLGTSYNFTQIQDPNLLVAGCAACTMLSSQVRPGLYSVDGNSLPQAPRWIANASLDYRVPLANSDEFFVSTDWSYRSSVNFFLYNSTEFTGKSLLEGGLRIGYKWRNGRYEIAAFGRNITDKVVAVGGIDFQNRTAFVNDPRLLGLQLKASF